MDETRIATPEEIQELIEFLPRLYAEDFEAEKEFRGSLNSPVYDPLINEFIKALSQPQWTDYEYITHERELRAPDAVERASLRQMKTLLTHFRRGENFCGGWWSDRIADGRVKRLLERLIVLKNGA